jgi:hypothetical protein
MDHQEVLAPVVAVAVAAEARVLELPQLVEQVALAEAAEL